MAKKNGIEWQDVDPKTGEKLNTLYGTKPNDEAVVLMANALRKIAAPEAAFKVDEVEFLRACLNQCIAIATDTLEECGIAVGTKVD